MFVLILLGAYEYGSAKDLLSHTVYDQLSLPVMPSSDIAEFKRILRNSKNIIAVAGAGLSAASGWTYFS
jgi:hypothetical protein